MKQKTKKALKGYAEDMETLVDRKIAEMQKALDDPATPLTAKKEIRRRLDSVKRDATRCHRTCTAELNGAIVPKEDR